MQRQLQKINNPNDIQTFAERLVRVKDGRGRSVTDRMFDPKTVNPEDFEFQDGGRVELHGRHVSSWCCKNWLSSFT